MKNVLLFSILMLAPVAAASDFVGADGPTYETIAETERTPVHALGLTVPQGWEASQTVQAVEPVRGELPKKFSWIGKITPIRNQGSCGSCWSFAAQASIADALALHGKGQLDLSEQWMVACDKQSDGCNGGWYHSAFALVMREGDVLEKDMPYKGKDMACPASLPHIYKVNGYKALSTGVASVEQIKQAIYQYGPVAVAVSASGDFQRYKSGIYNGPARGPINHAVNIVGWDETVRPAHWIMRNSWGTGWGEGGFMRIAYGSKRIGYAATYVDALGPVPHESVTPEGQSAPCPDCKDCPECQACTFWRFLAHLFAV